MRRRPAQIHRILIAHHLLLGDTLMLTALLAALRQRYPSARLVMTCPQAITPLYSTHPYGVEVIGFNPRQADTVQAVLRSGPYDLGIVPGDNRHAWLALAAGCRWIVAHADDTPAWKNWPVDEAIPFPDTPTAWGDMAAQLGGGDGSLRYRPSDWPAPAAKPFAQPRQPYVVLHPGASTPLKYWPSDRWIQLAAWLVEQGYQPVWSAGAKETALIDTVDPQGLYPSFAGQLDLAQLWQLLAGAAALICPDTGVAHLGRLTNTPTLALFGPGNALISGTGQFWADSTFVALTETDISCRNQTVLFRRNKDWIRRCGRNTAQCASVQCMDSLDLVRVKIQLSRILQIEKSNE
ncbi:glycosyltransferase family 9 protein [Chitinilyticum litopenaei]|uniref:Glycosyltransferase family 9 protein n=1 Tax=Chitinilyticum piscinae TaxID=2866724 RepID=A0A8J7FH35_9NEIS|nr:glycosyltransferase family 9 protein [Chitinilyticum piscinae]